MRVITMTRRLNPHDERMRQSHLVAAAKSSLSRPNLNSPPPTFQSMVESQLLGRFSRSTLNSVGGGGPTSPSQSRRLPPSMHIDPGTSASSPHLLKRRDNNARRR